jgi:hypothetical protein
MTIFVYKLNMVNRLIEVTVRAITYSVSVVCTRICNSCYQRVLKDLLENHACSPSYDLAPPPPPSPVPVCKLDRRHTGRQEDRENRDNLLRGESGRWCMG